jgi:hypothetical protein
MSTGEIAFLVSSMGITSRSGGSVTGSHWIWVFTATAAIGFRIHAFLLIHNKVTIFEKCQDVHLPFESLIVASLPFRFDVCQRSMTASGSLLDLQTKNGSRIIVQKWHGPYIAQKVEFHDGLVCVIQRVGPLQVLHVCQGGCSEEIICHSFALPSDDSIVT